MNRASDDNDSRMIPKDQVGPPLVDESSSGGSLNGGGQILKKGPWTSAEDKILIEYVKKHGEGNWNAVQKHSGLSRCGKSCRLRWANHLRPNLKKCTITPEEEQLIIELHARMGNKWARMAAYLPGRTDNEIKNFWNTRIKRRQRMGLPLYPPNICFQSSDDNHQSHCTTEYDCSEKQAKKLGFDLADVMFDHVNCNPGALAYAPPFLDISMNSVIGQKFAPQSYGLINPVVGHAKHYRESETLIPGFHDIVSGILPPFEQLPVEPYGKMQQISNLGYPYDPDPNENNLAPSERDAIPGSHAFINGNFSASKPLHGPVKLELPSLQYSETDGVSSFPSPSPSPPPYEAIETYIESPPKRVSLQCESVSPRNSGLLDALILEAQVISSSKKQPSEKNSCSSIIIPNGMVENSEPNISETEWEDYSDPVSPLGSSAASVFNEYTPVCGSSLDLLPHSRAASMEILGDSKHDTTTDVVGKNLWKPDALLGSAWLVEDSQNAKDHSVLDSSLASFLGQDLCTGAKSLAAGTSTAPMQGFGLDSYPWHNMPSACQISEFP